MTHRLKKRTVYTAASKFLPKKHGLAGVQGKLYDLIDQESTNSGGGAYPTMAPNDLQRQRTATRLASTFLPHLALAYR